MGLAGARPLLMAARGAEVSDQRRQIEHQLRTALTTVSLAGQLLQRDSNSTERQQRLANEIVRACDRLEQCLSELIAHDDANHT